MSLQLLLKPKIFFNQTYWANDDDKKWHLFTRVLLSSLLHTAFLMLLNNPFFYFSNSSEKLESNVEDQYKAI